MRCFVFLGLIFYYIIMGAVAISQNIDSLAPRFDSLKAKKTDLLLCNKLAKELYNEQAIPIKYNFTKKTPEDSINVVIYSGLGIYYYNVSNFSKSISYVQSSIAHNNLINDVGINFENYSTLSCCYQRIGDIDKAISNAKKSLILSKMSSDLSLESSALNNLGTIYLYSKQAEKGFEYLSKSLEVERNVEGSPKLSTRLSNLAESYILLGAPAKAIPLILEAKNIDLKADKINNVGIRLSVLANAYLSMGKFEDAEKSYLESINYLNLSKNKPSLAITYYQLGMLYLKMDNITKSLYYLDECSAVCDSFNFTYTANKAFNGKYNIYKRQKNYVLALENLEKAKILHDTIFNQQMQKSVANYQVMYELSEKNSQILIQEEQIKKAQLMQNFLQILISAAILICALLFLFAFMKRRYARKLEFLNNAKDKLFSIISHDLKSPIVAQKIMVEDLIKNYDKFDTDNIKRYFGILRDAAESQISLLQNLMEWSHLQIGKTQYTPIKFNLYNSICATVRLYSISAEQKNIEIQINSQKNIMVFADKQMINTVIRNIVSNAIKFSPNNNYILIEVASMSGNFRVSITDNGIGMNQYQVKSIFSLGKTIQRDGTNGEKGSGLGLAICNEILKKHNSSLKVESKENKGTKISFVLSEVS